MTLNHATGLIHPASTECYVLPSPTSTYRHKKAGLGYARVITVSITDVLTPPSESTPARFDVYRALEIQHQRPGKMQ